MGVTNAFAADVAGQLVQLEGESQPLLASHPAISFDLLVRCRCRGHKSSIIQLPIADNCCIRQRAAADRDAAHIALATIHEMDMLLTWNCRHIANAFIQAKLRKLADAAGFTLPVICTPEELLENENEQTD